MPRASDLRGAGRLAIDATLGITDLVEAMHTTIARYAPGHQVVRGVTGLVYGGVRGVTQLVGRGLDTLLDQPDAAGARASHERDALVAAVNGVLGDHLAASGNPLALTMRLRFEGRELDPVRDVVPGAGPRVLILVHGLCMSHRQWSRGGHDHGEALARDLALTVLHLHYNSGLHVSANGRDFASLLEPLVRHWPVPLRDLSIVGHSMGGLVTRAACHHAQESGHRWLRTLRRVVFLGTPHHGSPVERGGNWIDAVLAATAVTAPLARLGHIRSAGVTDLRHGSVADDDWQGADRFARASDRRRHVPLPAGVRCYAVAASRSRGRGDGLVPIDSALGLHPDRHRSLRIPASRRVVVEGTGHFDLLASAEVYRHLRRWLRRPATATRRPSQGSRGSRPPAPDPNGT